MNDGKNDGNTAVPPADYSTDVDAMLDSFDISIPSTKLQQHILTGDSQGGHVENYGGSLVLMSMAESLHDKAVDTDYEFAQVVTAWVESCS